MNYEAFEFWERIFGAAIALWILVGWTVFGLLYIGCWLGMIINRSTWDDLMELRTVVWGKLTIREYELFARLILVMIGPISLLLLWLFKGIVCLIEYWNGIKGRLHK